MRLVEQWLLQHFRHLLSLEWTWKWSRKQQSPLGKSDEEGRVTIIILMVVFMGCLSLLSMGLLLIWEKVAQILAELGSVYFSLVSVELGFWEIYCVQA